jgi:predicted ATPase/DNA-binding XRE family transcriptional regulator
VAKTPSETFGDLLRRYRVAAGLTQEELAEKAQVSPRAISDLERGARNRPYRATVQLLADALQLGPAERTQVAAAARRASLPATESIERDAALDTPLPRHNLPIPVTSFVGRQREVADVQRLALEARLITLTGIGGSGKTRLALQVAATLVDTFRGQVTFVPLNATTDANLAGSAVLQALGMPSASTNSPSWDQLAQSLGDRRVLLVLDNLEQVLSVGPPLAQLIERCPNVTVLATSRAALRVSGEQEYVVSPLALPDPGRVTSLERLGRNEAVSLFAERARAVRSGFALTEGNVAAVAEICRRLDGLPLAIELAAARARLFGPEELRRRLDDRLVLLAGGAKDRPTRQQTLRATLDWSYDLLAPAEQALFRQLAVFAGGFTLDAAEAVVESSGVAPLDVLEGVDSLVGKSLLQVTERRGDARFAMLETTRAYARERLIEHGQEKRANARHAEYYLALAEASALQVGALAGDRDDLRAALDWFEASGDVVTLARLIIAMQILWSYNGPLTEGRDWVARFRTMAKSSDVPVEVRARVLMAEGQLELRWDARATRGCGEELLALGRATANAVWTEWALTFLGWSSLQLGELGRAEGELHERLALKREMGSPERVVNTLILLGNLARLRGDDELARARYDESRTLSAAEFGPWQLRNLGFLAVHRGVIDEAERLFQQALTEYESGANVLGQVECLVGFAALAAARDQLGRAARLLGAVDSALTILGLTLDYGDRFEYERTMRALRAPASVIDLDRARGEGQAMTLKQAIDDALKLATRQQ